MSKRKIESLSDYLAQIERELRWLPNQARESELREIEAHLRALVEASQSQKDADAVAQALAQFGEPRRVGRDLRKAWERKQPEEWWRAVLSPLAGWAISDIILLPMFIDLWAFWAHPTANIDPLFLGYQMYKLQLITVFIGAFAAGCISPKHSKISVPLTFFLLPFLPSIFFAPSSLFESASAIYIRDNYLLSTITGVFCGAYIGKNSMCETLKPNKFANKFS